MSISIHHHAEVRSEIFLPASRYFSFIFIHSNICLLSHELNIFGIVFDCVCGSGNIVTIAHVEKVQKGRNKTGKRRRERKESRKYIKKALQRGCDVRALKMHQCQMQVLYVLKLPFSSHMYEMNELNTRIKDHKPTNNHHIQKENQ